MNQKKLLDEVKAKIDTISPSFCAAKWKQVTIHLQNGMNHSCHHPSPHVVPVSEIKIDSSALHNSEYKKKQRKMMLEGDRPKECDYCWKVEDSASNEHSDRVVKSGMSWARHQIDSIAATPWDANVYPSNVEVSFSNVCNFKCSYCAPHISSKWMEEIEQHGPYPSGYNSLNWIKAAKMMPIPAREENPYVEAFWDWWPRLYPEISNFRITGGEPLLSKETFKVLDSIIDNEQNLNLQLGINSNFNVPDELFDKFIEKIKIIIDNNKVGSVRLFTSAEAHGSASEYIRFGMDYNKWVKNLYRVSRELPSVGIVIMSTYNILSVGTYKSFLNDILLWKKEFRSGDKNYSMNLLDIPYLRKPEHQSVFILEPDLLPLIKEQLDFMRKHQEDGFTELECRKMQIIYDLTLTQSLNNDIIQNRRDFISFVDEHDRRRGTNFKDTFPELAQSYKKWKYE